MLLRVGEGRLEDSGKCGKSSSCVEGSSLDMLVIFVCNSVVIKGGKSLDEPRL